METKVKETLEIKLRELELVMAWFDFEYKKCYDENILKEYEKQEVEINSQIKLLRFLLSD